MNAIEGVAWQCSTCKQWYLARANADKCCGDKPKRMCEDCGVEIPERWYKNKCSFCIEKDIYNKARKLTYEEYTKEFPDHGIMYQDNYFEEMEDLIEYIEDEMTWNEGMEYPAYVYGTTKVWSKVDIEQAIEYSLEDMYEDAEYSADEVAKLVQFVEDWSAKNRLCSFYENNKVAILLD